MKNSKRHWNFVKREKAPGTEFLHLKIRKRTYTWQFKEEKRDERKSIKSRQGSSIRQTEIISLHTGVKFVFSKAIYLFSFEGQWIQSLDNWTILNWQSFI